MAKTKYHCRTCHATKWLPEPPQNPQPKIRTGCDHCEAIMPHYPLGSSAWLREWYQQQH